MSRSAHPREPMPEHVDPMPEHVDPMLARTGGMPREREHHEWGFEVKWDGVRAILYWRDGRMRMEGRNRRDITARYPELRTLGEQLGACDAVLDGEIVAFEERGTPSFERLQKRMHLTEEGAVRRAAREVPAAYMIFDLLHFDGRSTTMLPYRRRRELLERLSLSGPAWRTPAYHAGEGRELLAATAERGLEGVVAKRLDSPYRPGRRDGEWVKIKNHHRQELVIGGWLEGKEGRAGRLGALLVGYHDRRVLRYAGRVGTGFDEPELRRLEAELAARASVSSPFAKSGVQPPRQSRFVEPQLVAEIEFSSWTSDNILRHSRYKGLREDKPAEQVSREDATA